MILGNIHSREEWLDYGFAIQQVLDWLISGGKKSIKNQAIQLSLFLVLTLGHLKVDEVTWEL